MIVLLPPSENKAARTRGATLRLPEIAWAEELTEARETVLDAVARASEAPEASKTLGVSANLVEEIARNTRLRTSPTLPASAMYTGVLYDALDYGTLDRRAKARAARRIIISSALYGAVRPNDRLAPYRLSMAVNLREIGPLASFWKARLATPLSDAAGTGLIVDCRSSTYATSWTPPVEKQPKWVHIRVPGATHMAKHTRGLFTRYLMMLPKDPTSAEALASVSADAFEVALHEPASGAKPWVLDVSTR